MVHKEILCLDLEDLGRVFTLGEPKFCENGYFACQVSLKFKKDSISIWYDLPKKAILSLRGVVFESGELIFQGIEAYELYDEEFRRDGYISESQLTHAKTNEPIADVKVNRNLMNFIAAYVTLNFYQRLGLSTIKKVFFKDGTAYNPIEDFELNRIKYIIECNYPVLLNYNELTTIDDIDYPIEDDFDVEEELEAIFEKD